MNWLVTLIFLSSILFSSSTISLLKENKNVLRMSVSKAFTVDSDGFDIINEGERNISLHYIFNGNYRFMGAFGVDSPSTQLSFYYYKIWDGFFINSALNIYKNSEDTKFYNDAVFGLGLSRKLSDSNDLSGQFFYISTIDRQNNFTSLSGIVYLDTELTSSPDLSLQIGLLKDFSDSDLDPTFYFSLSYLKEIN